jgi:hypothetical protein
MAVKHPVALPFLPPRSPEQLPGDRFSPRPGEPHDRHAALPRGDGGGDGGDGVGGGGGGGVGGGGVQGSARGGPPFSARHAGGREGADRAAQELVSPGNTIRSM